MPKSNSRSVFGRSGRSGTVTVIEAPVALNFRRRARVTFFVVAFTTFVLASVVASHYLHPILGILLGALIGVVVAIPPAALVLAWPVLRVFVRWWVELVTVTGAAAGLVLAEHAHHRCGVAAGRCPAGWGTGRDRAVPPVHPVTVHVPGGAASAAGGVQRLHRVQPAGLAAADPARPADPGRGTGVGVAAARPVLVGTGRPDRQARRGLLGEGNHHRPGIARTTPPSCGSTCAA